jgi:hypothetical protein
MKTTKTTFLAIISCLALIGCGPEFHEQVQITENSFKNPKFIGEIHGRKLYQSQYVFGPYPNAVHYIYFFSDTNLVSVNYPETQGKITVNKTIVIDGKEFELKPRN